jgi:hypothetical protein
LRRWQEAEAANDATTSVTRERNRTKPPHDSPVLVVAETSSALRSLPATAEFFPDDDGDLFTSGGVRNEATPFSPGDA